MAAIGRIRQLATLRLVDRVIAEKLNSEGVKSGSGRAWTASSVKHVRLEHKHLCRYMTRPAIASERLANMPRFQAEDSRA